MKKLSSRIFIFFLSVIFTFIFVLFPLVNEQNVPSQKQNNLEPVGKHHHYPGCNQSEDQAQTSRPEPDKCNCIDHLVLRSMLSDEKFHKVILKAPSFIHDQLQTAHEYFFREKITLLPLQISQTATNQFLKAIRSVVLLI